MYRVLVLGAKVGLFKNVVIFCKYIRNKEETVRSIIRICEENRLLYKVTMIEGTITIKDCKIRIVCSVEKLMGVSNDTFVIHEDYGQTSKYEIVNFL